MSYVPAADRYSKIPYRRCGNSGLVLPAISLGLWQNFGHVDLRSNFENILYTAFDLGITHFDLANNYGPPPAVQNPILETSCKKDSVPTEMK